MLNSLNAIKFVLVNTSHPGNIGAVARAMKVMGLSELTLVQPAQFPADEATWRAAGGKDLLENATVVETLDEALEACNIVYATSARTRNVPWPLAPLRDAAIDIVNVCATNNATAAIVFGREDRGLTNEELQKCNAHLTIPSDEEYGVLNIAAAAQVVAYELRQAALAGKEFENDWDVPLAEISSVEQLHTHLLQVMEDVGFYRQENPKQMPTRIKRLLMRERLDEMEVNMLRGFLKLTQRKLGTEKSLDD